MISNCNSQVITKSRGDVVGGVSADHLTQDSKKYRAWDHHFDFPKYWSSTRTNNSNGFL